MRKHLHQIIFGAMVAVPLAALGDDPPAAKKVDRRIDDPPAPFVPLHPRTADEQNRVEVLRLFASARALEDSHQLGEAIDILEKARKLSPDSTTILSHLSRLNLALGRVDAAVTVAKHLVEVEPGDAGSISLLVAYYLERKNDPGATEAVLRKIVANPKLDKKSAGYFLALRVLGDLYADALNRPADAADTYAKLMDSLDERAANALSPRDKARIIDGDEVSLYSHFGDTFLKADRPAMAVKAFRRGLVYKPDHPILARSLARALLADKHPAEALAALEPHIKRQPAGVDDYELLIDILEASGKKEDVLPKLEAAAKADPKNLRLQFFLADRYRAEGQQAKAEALLAELLKNEGDPQVYGALAESYKRAKKADELLKLLGKALDRPEGLDAVRPTLEAIGNEPEMAGRLLDAGLHMIETDPPALTPKARELLGILATNAKLGDQLVAIDRAAVKADASASNLRLLAIDLYYPGQKFNEAADAMADLIAKFPAEKNALNTLMISRGRFFGGKVEEALEAAKVSQAIDANNKDTLQFMAFILGQLGRDDEAISIYEDMLKRFPNDDEAIRSARSGLSASYVNKGDFVRGEAELETLYRDDPEDPGVNNDLGYLYADQGKNLEKAEEMIRKAVREEPENASYLDSLGWVLFKQGKVNEAVEPLEKAFKSERTDVTICEHLGDVMFRLRDFTKAAESWKKAEQLASKATPPAKRLPEIRKKLAELEKLNPTSKPSGRDEP